VFYAVEDEGLHCLLCYLFEGLYAYCEDKYIISLFIWVLRVIVPA
jgi:hypothetical protein